MPTTTQLQPLGRVTLLAGDCTAELKDVGRSFARNTRQRYMDPSAELGIMALHLAVEQLGGSQALPADPFRRALFVVTACGPQATRAKLQDGYRNPNRSTLSGTVFSNCGYNIAGSLMARSQSIRGGVLTFGAAPGWERHVPAMAQTFLARRRADWLALAVLDDACAEVSWYVADDARLQPAPVSPVAAAS